MVGDLLDESIERIWLLNQFLLVPRELLLPSSVDHPLLTIVEVTDPRYVMAVDVQCVLDFLPCLSLMEFDRHDLDRIGDAFMSHRMGSVSGTLDKFDTWTILMIVDDLDGTGVSIMEVNQPIEVSITGRRHNRGLVGLERILWIWFLHFGKTAQIAHSV